LIYYYLLTYIIVLHSCDWPMIWLRFSVCYAVHAYFAMVLSK